MKTHIIKSLLCIIIIMGEIDYEKYIVSNDFHVHRLAMLLLILLKTIKTPGLETNMEDESTNCY